jgi:hypothetical protein
MVYFLNEIGGIGTFFVSLIFQMNYYGMEHYKNE